MWNGFSRLALLALVVVSVTGSHQDSSSCPNCVKNISQRKLDSIRIEAIKNQLLSKLGLKERPLPAHVISKKVLHQTLSRTDRARILNDIQEPTGEDSQEELKVSEIIKFAEPGKSSFNSLFGECHSNSRSAISVELSAQRVVLVLF